MKLLAATSAHAAAMASAHAQAFDAPWDQATIEELLAGSGAFAFVALGEDPLGMILCRAIGGEAEVLTLAVPPWTRRKGVARALMTAAVAQARTAGASQMFLEVDVDNTAAIGLYERLGFSRAGVRKAYYDRGARGRADALVMRLDLTPRAG
ncbi:MAG TPA: ribosomal protein S18-alanine N-acetyltransferase [Phenylobacterium sp.]|nr:ribosomal protein S18-alanine N-acetyltransferase [Phenylobacterium sp.]